MALIDKHEEEEAKHFDSEIDELELDPVPQMLNQNNQVQQLLDIFVNQLNQDMAAAVNQN